MLIQTTNGTRLQPGSVPCMALLAGCAGTDDTGRQAPPWYRAALPELGPANPCGEPCGINHAGDSVRRAGNDDAPLALPRRDRQAWPWSPSDPASPVSGAFAKDENQVIVGSGQVEPGNGASPSPIEAALLRHAFMGTAATGMADIDVLAAPDDPLTGNVELRQSDVITDDGKIAGRALVDRVARARVLIPLKNRS